VKSSQRRELTDELNHSTGSYELVLSPLILALIGFWLDGVLGTRPWITIIAAVLGLTGAVIKLYYGYRAEMDGHEENAPWAKPS